jgi:hypothetical protein
MDVIAISHGRSKFDGVLKKQEKLGPGGIRIDL